MGLYASPAGMRASTVRLEKGRASSFTFFVRLQKWRLDLMFKVGIAGGQGVNWQTGLNQLGFVSWYSPIFENDDGTLLTRPLLLWDFGLGEDSQWVHSSKLITMAKM